MANFVNVENLSYNGEYAKEIFLKSLYESKLKEYGITYMPGVKGQQQIVTGTVGDIFQKFTCPFSASGEVTLSQDMIKGVPMKVNLEECYDAFWSTFMASQTEVTLNGGVPVAFQDWFFNETLVPTLKKQYEQIFWNGDTKNGATDMLKILDGVVNQISKNTGSVIQGAALTVDNIATSIESVIMKALASNDNFEDYKLFINVQDYQLLKVALGKQNISSNNVFANFGVDGDKIYAYGFEVVPCQIAKDTMVCGPAKNLILGYDVEDSEISYKFVDMRESTLDNTFRVGVITNMAVGVAYPSTMVLYKKQA